MRKSVNQGSFADRLALWGVDRPAADAEMLLDFIENLAQNQPVPAMAQSMAELEARRPALKMRLRHSLGLDPWPERTALNARVVGKLERRGYTIEKLVYEAWPGLPVSAHFIPPGSPGRTRPGTGICVRALDGSGKISPVCPALLCQRGQLSVSSHWSMIRSGRVKGWKAGRSMAI